MPLSLDATDRAILQALQRGGNLPNTELADELGLTPSTCLRRVKRLEDSGLIAGYVMLLDPDLAGIGATVYVSIKLKNQLNASVTEFEQEILDIPEVLECHLVLGQTDYILKLAVRDLEHYRELMLGRLTQIPSVATIESMMSLKRVKSTTVLPLLAT
ncbi:Lrp/AsnC family transcriptional regulator [Deinococcus sp.]|uniref:Lrp/AsnC family transcriptional regulator n=1 Tax=Deinococcus sp. TaxID=47478 RepID=UPI0026015D1B|nr:Lrp/AsnC family transcriptional regulator [Deinococcus sp.]